MKKLTFLLVLILSAAALNLFASGSKEETLQTASPEADKVIFALDWTPNTNHTGLYVALEKGYFSDANLDVEFIMPQTSVKQLVATDSAHFGISFQEFATFDMINDGAPLLSVAAILQHNVSGLTSLAEKGITRPRDLAGKTFGSWGTEFGQAMVRYLIEQDGGDADTLKNVVMGEGNFAALLRTEMDFAWTYFGWQNIDLEVQGAPETNYMSLPDIDPVFDYYSPVIVTSRKRAAEEPELVGRFMKAVQKGYEYMIAHPAESADILLKYAPELDARLVHRSQEYLTPYYMDDGERWGVQDKEVWSRLALWMKESGIVDGDLDVSAAMSNRFLEQ